MSKSNAAPTELLSEGLRCEKAGLLDRALELYREAREGQDDPAVLAESWRLEAYAHHGRCAWDEALPAARRSVEIAREAGLADLVAEGLNAEAAVHLARGALEDAGRLFAAMLDMTTDARIRGVALQNLGTILGQQGDLEGADRRFREAYEAFDRADYEWGKAHVLNNTVAVAIRRGDFDAAEAMGESAVKLARTVNDLDLLAIATLNLAEALAGTGDVEAAQDQASMALGHFEVSGNRWRRVTCLRVLGDMSALLGDDATAHAFWSRGLTLAREIEADGEAVLLAGRLDPGHAGEGAGQDPVP